MLEHFSTGKTTTQRSERMNNIVKMRIRSHFTLLEFIEKFENVLLGIREKENNLDHHVKFAPERCVTPLAIEASTKGFLHKRRIS